MPVQEQPTERISRKCPCVSDIIWRDLAALWGWLRLRSDRATSESRPLTECPRKADEPTLRRLDLLGSRDSFVITPQFDRPKVSSCATDIATSWGWARLRAMQTLANLIHRSSPSSRILDSNYTVNHAKSKELLRQTENRSG